MKGDICSSYIRHLISASKSFWSLSLSRGKLPEVPLPTYGPWSLHQGPFDLCLHPAVGYPRYRGGRYQGLVKIQSYQMFPLSSLKPFSGELRTQKLKSHLVRKQSLNVLPVKPWVGQYIAIHATLTARDFFFAYFYPSGPFSDSPAFFPKHLPIFFPCWLWLTPVPM